MGDRTDEAKGRLKEAAGDLTDDKDLEREGKLDRAGATVKRKAEETVDKAKEKVNELLDDDR
jgi:uncharacterized protein YjbJ (UPF0337 family)